MKWNSRAARLYIASRIGGPIERGERLRSVMAAAGIHTPLRKLTGYAIQPYMSSFVRDLVDLDPSTLSQAIPDKGRAQRHWLASLRDWRARMKIRNRSPKLHFQWIARHAHRCERGQAGDFADFVGFHPSLDVSRWSFEHMANEVQLWHDRLAADRSVAGLGVGIRPDTVIDLSDWPDHAEVGGFEFFKLSTPSMLMEEGRRMRHCVATYIPMVMNGKCHIYSIRADLRRMATVEIIGSRVVQIKAFGNKIPSTAVRDAADKFALMHKPRVA
ncbi:PcfJ domain-containing protein [Sphingobium sp.]|uniref:PcfJ domain-containing protein n=1 Tax=Sphingobium sp. TaxID=1912891 RepID=UPI0035C6F126